MRYISGKAQIRFRWTIWKHENTTKEDFDAGLPKVILIGPEDKYYIPVELVKGDLVGALPTMLPSGVYTLKAMWAKNKSRRFDGKVLVSEAKCFMGISYDEEEIDKDCKEIRLAIRTCIGTYGTDGFTAYEIAVMYGQTDLKETEWSNVNVDLAEAEHERVLAEQSRVVSESVRLSSEATRVGSEAQRQSAEAARAQAEAERRLEEETRKVFEEDRDKNESERLYSEALRVGEEEKRVWAEESRVKAEATREANERYRMLEEEARLLDENARHEGEAIRAANEEQRREAEAAREANEADRQQTFERNEATREQTFAQKEAERDEAISSVTEFEEQVQYSIKVIPQELTGDAKKQACSNIGVYPIRTVTEEEYAALEESGELEEGIMYAVLEGE